MVPVHSFDPVHDETAECLILGTMPGRASLAAREYYAHPRNHFWPFIASILDTPASAPYTERCRLLVAHRIALWDVLGSCVRSGSLDADIVEASIVPNDFRGFLNSHPRLRTIFFNGAKAEQIYLRQVQPRLPAGLQKIATVRLPSTSPANASIPVAVKLDKWRQALGALGKDREARAARVARRASPARQKLTSDRSIP